MMYLIATTFVEHGTLTLRLNDEVIMENKDEITLELTPGHEYYVSWFVTGNAGSVYAITISSPAEAQFQLSKVLGKSGQDFNFFRFTT